MSDLHLKSQMRKRNLSCTTHIHCIGRNFNYVGDSNRLRTLFVRLLVAIMGINEFMQKLILFDGRSLLLKQSDLFWRNGQAKLKTWLSWQSFCVSVSQFALLICATQENFFVRDISILHCSRLTVWQEPYVFLS